MALTFDNVTDGLVDWQPAPPVHPWKTWVAIVGAVSVTAPPCGTTQELMEQLAPAVAEVAAIMVPVGAF